MIIELFKPAQQPTIPKGKSSKSERNGNGDVFYIIYFCATYGDKSPKPYEQDEEKNNKYYP